MNSEYRFMLRAKIVDGLAMAVPAFTRRDVHIPGIRGKAMAVIGMRRSGKTTFLWQCLADRLSAGTPREALTRGCCAMRRGSTPPLKARHCRPSRPWPCGYATPQVNLVKETANKTQGKRIKFRCVYPATEPARA